MFKAFRGALAALCFVFPLAVGVATAATPYEFRLLPAPPSATLANAGSINNLGEVSLHLRFPDSEAIAAFGRSGSVSTVIDSSGPLAAFTPSPFPYPISNDSRVAFAATLATGGPGIFSARNGALATIADTSGIFSGFTGLVAINDSGAVVFNATLKEGGTGIYVGSGGEARTIVDTRSGVYSAFTTASPGTYVANNNGGDVAFAAVLASGEQAIYRMDASGAMTPIADTSGPFSGLGVQSMNDRGDIAFVAEYDAGGRAIYVGSGGAVTKVADHTDGFPRVSNPSINNNGLVSFVADVGETDAGLFIYGPGTGLQRIAGTGDAFLGSVIRPGRLQGARGIFQSVHALNDLDEISFLATLVNGETFYAVAVPVPEPSALVLAGVGFIAVVVYVSKRRRAGTNVK